MKTKPDFWYKQSSAIPFGFIGNSLEVLIVTTRKKKWIFPKGIVEPRTSARETAVKESIEEAGVNGELLLGKVGSYSYKKWGGKCKVKVYGLRVDSLRDSWEEDFRERKWIAIDEVGKYITRRKIISIVETLKHLVKNEQNY